MSGAAAHGHRAPPPAAGGPRPGPQRRKIYTVLVIEHQEGDDGPNSGDHNSDSPDGGPGAGLRIRYCKAGVVAPPGNFHPARGNQLPLYQQQPQQQDTQQPTASPLSSSSSPAPAAAVPAAAAATATAAARLSAGPAKHGSAPFVLPVRGCLLASYHFTGLRPPSFSDRPHSFGLHSPDQLPQSESEFKAIASSFGLHSPDNVAPTEKLHPSYNPRLFCDGGLYLDPDIIGESLLPFTAPPVIVLPLCSI